MPTVRRLHAHVGALNACEELSRKGILPKPYIIIGVSAGAAAGASCLPWTEANLKTAAHTYAGLDSGKISYWPWPTAALAILSSVTTLYPVINYILRKALKSQESGKEAEKLGLYIGEIMTSWILIGLLQYFFWKSQSVFSNRKLRHLFFKGPENGGLDLEGIFKSDVLFEMTATDVENAKEVIFTNYLEKDRDPERFVEALLASTSTVGSFPPSKIDGRILGDGGIISRLPIHRALHHDVDAIVVFYYHSIFEREKGPFSWLESIIRSTEISETVATCLMLENYQLRRNLGEKLPSGKNLPPLFKLSVKDPRSRLPNIGLRNFKRQHAIKAMNIAYNAVYDNLEDLKKICC